MDAWHLEVDRAFGQMAVNASGELHSVSMIRLEREQSLKTFLEERIRIIQEFRIRNFLKPPATFTTTQILQAVNQIVPLLCRSDSTLPTQWGCFLECIPR